MSYRWNGLGGGRPGWLGALLVTGAFAGVALGAAPAHAQPEEEADETARLRFEAGSNLYAAGDFEGAAREFEAAYELSGRPQLLYNMYVAWRDAGNVRRAADALERYLDEVPDAPERVTLEARLEAMKQQIAERDAADAAARESAARAEAATEAATAEDGRPSGFVRNLHWLFGGVGVAMLVAGTVTGGLALSLEGQLEDDCPANVCPAQRADDIDRLDALSTATDVLIFGGAALAVTGVVLYFVGPARWDDEGEEGVGVSPMGGCTSTGCLAGITGRFE